MSTLVAQNLFTGKSAQNYAAVLQRDQVAILQELSLYIVFSAGAGAGAVVVEGAHDPDYSGTWANLATVNWSAADKCHIVQVTGVHRAVRLRISTAVTGGTVAGYSIGKS